MKTTGNSIHQLDANEASRLSLQRAKQLNASQLADCLKSIHTASWNGRFEISEKGMLDNTTVDELRKRGFIVNVKDKKFKNEPTKIETVISWNADTK